MAKFNRTTKDNDKVVGIYCQTCTSRVAENHYYLNARCIDKIVTALNVTLTTRNSRTRLSASIPVRIFMHAQKIHTAIFHF